MPKIYLTPEDKAKLIEAMNNGTEPPPEILPKLFPGTAEKFDLQALNRAKIPTLEYAGKRSRAAILAEAGAGIGAGPLQIVRCFSDDRDDEWQNMIVQGDNLQFLKTCYKNIDPLIKDKVKGRVNLIYIDPPFATMGDFNGKNGERSYSDKVATAEFLERLRERLIYMRYLLSNTGLIYLHIDCRLGHYVKVLMDEIFEKHNFQNQIIWQRTDAHNDVKKRYGNIHDIILVYSKSDEFDFYPDAFRDETTDVNLKEYSLLELPDGSVVPYKGNELLEGRRFRTVDATWKGSNNVFEWRGSKPTGRREWMCSFEEMEAAYARGELYLRDPSKGAKRCKKFYLDQNKGLLVQDIWTQSGRMKGGSSYPTEKPEALLEQIIRLSTKDDDLVVDFFAGSGTTAAVAEKLGRRWITCDFGKHAIYNMQRRMLRIGETKALLGENNKSGKVTTKKTVPYKQDLKQFCVVSSGAYDFAHIMDLRKHKETYIDFVLGLFQLARDEEKAAKYKLVNIFTVKDNNPVEVYPIWEDQFLKEVKIDESYLRDIITQSGGKLKGDYYIITPESCTNVGDTTLKNQDNNDLHFQMLTFPYKVLEDVSRNLALQDQPSSQADVNTLITSTAFYFNEDVTINATRTNDGIKITKFETKILNKDGTRFEGFSGISMLLVDLNYEVDKPFDMDKTVFGKEIAEDGSLKIEGLTKRVGLIAIDRHGNESKPFNLD